MTSPVTGTGGSANNSNSKKVIINSHAAVGAAAQDANYTNSERIKCVFVREHKHMHHLEYVCKYLTSVNVVAFYEPFYSCNCCTSRNKQHKNLSKNYLPVPGIYPKCRSVRPRSNLKFQIP